MKKTFITKAVPFCMFLLFLGKAAAYIAIACRCNDLSWADICYQQPHKFIDAISFSLTMAACLFVIAIEMDEK